MDRWLGKVAIVTGASSGIGAQICVHLVNYGLIVIGLARRQEKLAEVENKCRYRNGRFHYFVTDIRKEEEVVNAFQWVKQNVGVVNILVNSAGVNRFSSLMEGNSTHIKEILDTNIFGLCIATREALKDMQNNEIDGHIIHINCTLGLKVLSNSNFNVYPASKFATTALTETLRNELFLINSKIKISSISPGYVETGLTENAVINNDGYYTEGYLKAMKERLKTKRALQPKDIADALIYILSTPPHVQIHDLIIKPVGEKFM